MQTTQTQEEKPADARAGENTTTYLSHSAFAGCPQAQPDPILAMAAAYRADTTAGKVNLSIGAYRCEEGKPYVFPVVK